MRGNFGKMEGAGNKKIRRAAAAVCEMLENRQMLDADSYTYLGVITTTVNESTVDVIYQARINCMNLSPGNTITAGYSLIPGTADPSDYGVTSGTVTLTGNGAYSASQIIYIPILADNVVEGSVMQSDGILIRGTETFTLHLDWVSEGERGYPSPPESRVQYTITIVDDPPIVSIAAWDDDAMENADGEAPNPGSVLLSRQGGKIADALPVLVSKGGTATYGVDYELGSTVIPAGFPYVEVPLSVIDDPDAEDVETADLLVTPCPAVYLLMDVAATNPATTPIADNPNVQTMAVTVTPPAEAGPEWTLYSGFDGYKFAAKIIVTGERLSLCSARQYINSSTLVYDWNGQPLQLPADVQTNSDGWKPDKGGEIWQSLAPAVRPQHNDGLAWIGDRHTFKMGVQQKPYGGDVVGVSSMIWATRYMRTEFKNPKGDVKTLNWGYKWNNFNLQWQQNDPIAPPPFQFCTREGGAGIFFEPEAITGLL